MNNVMLQLPCRPGTPAWAISWTGMKHILVKGIIKNFVLEKELELTFESEEYGSTKIEASSIGKTIFFTKEEGENRLQEKKEEKP